MEKQTSNLNQLLTVRWVSDCSCDNPNCPKRDHRHSLVEVAEGEWAGAKLKLSSETAFDDRGMAKLSPTDFEGDVITSVDGRILAKSQLGNPPSESTEADSEAGEITNRPDLLKVKLVGVVSCGNPQCPHTHPLVEVIGGDLDGKHLRVYGSITFACGIGYVPNEADGQRQWDEVTQ